MKPRLKRPVPILPHNEKWKGLLVAVRRLLNSQVTKLARTLYEVPQPTSVRSPARRGWKAYLLLATSGSNTPSPLKGEGVNPKDVKQALKDYYWSSKLANNPLITQLKLRVAPEEQDDPSALARALREVLDEALEALPTLVPLKLKDRAAGLGDYLRLRYKELERHKDLAARIGYHERQLNRLEKHLIEEMIKWIEAHFRK